MDEIDNIIIHSLRQIGCDIDEEIYSLSSFTPEMLVSSVSKCLTLIRPTLEVPQSLPPGMAQRFGVTTNLAEACKSVGFRGDIGYQTFLYTNVTEVRRVFMFLIEHLPKEAEKAQANQSLDYPSSVKQEIARNIQQNLSARWLPPPCRILLQERNTFSPRYLNIPWGELEDNQEHKNSEKPLTEEAFVSLFDQTSSETLFPSVIAKNDEELFVDQGIALSRVLDWQKEPLINRNAISEVQELHNSVSATEEVGEIVKNNTLKVRTPLESLQEEIEELRRRIEESVGERQGILEEIEGSKSTISQHEERLSGLRKEKRIRERTNIVLENPEENVAKLEAMVANSKEKLKKLELQWQEHEAPLLEALNSAQKKNSKEMSKTKHLVDQITSIRKKAEEITLEFKQKSSTHSQLTAELAKLSRTINRNAYTSRILEIIGNIRKQKNDIDRVLRDTRELQKTINTVTGQLDRQFTVTDDLIYRTAKRDENSRKAYKLLATLHADCAELINYVQETGATAREIRDLEDQIETEKMRNVSANLERITSDLHQMQKESQVLEEKLRSALQNEESGE
ncbi:coiled-coil domain-containing protein 22 homolog [Phlebotomus argentipes]|uniref:coiled-coil domain-containing protein 22 homolog n=1 Tax=Phlebotomus argentipes TaxID=94469 RepID=UPI002892B35B|nr:coiled-coil domain-containing protein 22 homolog [Phlebotomus argentipes]